MGVDTVKLSYDLRKLTDHPLEWFDCSPWSTSWRPGATSGVTTGGWMVGSHYGSVGPVWYTERIHMDGTKCMIKGVSGEAAVLWEMSVPKFLGLQGPADGECVRIVDRHLRRLIPALPRPTLRRVDVTDDLHDPDGRLRSAAIGWKPHARSRYVQAEYQDGETVWLHNKSRGVRVYDKYAECGEDWAYGLTRVEYQLRGPWCEKMGLDRLYQDFARNVEGAIQPVVAELLERARDRQNGPEGCSPRVRP